MQLTMKMNNGYNLVNKDFNKKILFHVYKYIFISFLSKECGTCVLSQLGWRSLVIIFLLKNHNLQRKKLLLHACIVCTLKA